MLVLIALTNYGVLRYVFFYIFMILHTPYIEIFSTAIHSKGKDEVVLLLSFN